ncbi:hypothetical protein NDU88_006351 [Pleurodeles waltl]|uniref:Uncharacterized protein n=1 Tax=Pleurodeles waltl TaxID=8319 RepID=A0AAV7TXM6_PLEWA|nr:hypothetical protein NDU88_006351 [Pleurodeles waltl]
MARVTGERAPAFTSAEMEKLVDGVLPQYRLLYGPPDQQVSAHQKKGILRAIAKDVGTLGVYGRCSTHCRKRWGNLSRWAWKMVEAQLGISSQRGRGARRTLTPLMARILAVAYPELNGRLGASQQQQAAVLTVFIFAIVGVHSGAGRKSTLGIREARAPWRRGSSLSLYSGQNIGFRLAVGSYRRGACQFRPGGQCVKVAACLSCFRHGYNLAVFTASLLAVLPPLYHQPRGL